MAGKKRLIDRRNGRWRRRGSASSDAEIRPARISRRCIVICTASSLNNARGLARRTTGRAIWLSCPCVIESVNACACKIEKGRSTDRACLDTVSILLQSFLASSNRPRRVSNKAHLWYDQLGRLTDWLIYRSAARPRISFGRLACIEDPSRHRCSFFRPFTPLLAGCSRTRRQIGPDQVWWSCRIRAISYPSAASRGWFVWRPSDFNFALASARQKKKKKRNSDRVNFSLKANLIHRRRNGSIHIHTYGHSQQ